MKVLLVYYSRTRITARVAEEIQKELNCDIEEIKDTTNRSGALNYIKSCLDGIRGTYTEIEPIEKDPSEYDLMIIGTPVWASTVANPVLTYLKDNKSKFNNVSFFCTCGSSGYNKTLAKMEELAGKEPVETLFMTGSDINSSFDTKIHEYIEKLNSNA